MRIAFVAPLVTAISEPQLGGSQALLADLASGLTERGHQVDVYAASGSSIEGVRVVDTGVDSDELRDSLFRAGQAVTSHPRVREAFAAVYEQVHSAVYEIVHNHAFDLAAIELSAHAGSPFVHTLHLPPDQSVARALEDARAEAPTTVACVSESSARGWSGLTEVDVVLRNGVPTHRIPFSEDPGEGLLFAGRLSPEKGAAEAVEIAERSGRPVQVVGSSYDEEYATGLASRVPVRPPVPRHELWRLMASSEAVLCPVSWEEPFGLVAAEAQAAGTPVVAFDRGALREVVRHEETGFLVNDTGEAARAVQKVPGIDRRRCREHAERNLDLAATLDAHERLYGQITDQSTEGSTAT